MMRAVWMTGKIGRFQVRSDTEHELCVFCCSACFVREDSRFKLRTLLTKRPGGGEERKSQPGAGDACPCNPGIARLIVKESEAALS
jgi:hypothetical protein